MGFWSQDFTHNSNVSHLCRRKHEMNIRTCRSRLLAANWSWSPSISSKSISSTTMGIGEQWNPKCGRLFTNGYKRKACSPLTSNLAFPSLVSVFHLTNSGRGMLAPPYLTTTSSSNKSLRTSVLSLPTNMTMTHDNVFMNMTGQRFRRTAGHACLIWWELNIRNKGLEEFCVGILQSLMYNNIWWPVVVDFGKSFCKL